MPAVLAKPKITKNEVLYGVSWEIYESLVEEYWELPSPRLTYDSGMLEINMSNSDKHEEDSRTLAKLFEIIAEELEINLRNFGSMTFKKQIIRKGFEPDCCFYIGESLNKIEGKSNIGIENEVPPDLIIEVNRTSSSIPRMPIFSLFGVKEVWRFSKKEVHFYQLSDGVYLEIETSLAVPILSSKIANEFLAKSKQTGSVAWSKEIRQWVAENRNKKL